MAGEGEDGGELGGGREWEVVSWFVPDLPLLEKSAANLTAQVGVGPWGHEVVGGAALSSEFCGGASELIAHDAYMTGSPPYLDC